MDFTVEVVAAPVTQGDWSTLRGVTDIIPGTILLEDPAEPMLIFPIEAETLQTAAVFVQGVMSVVGLDIKWGRAYRAEPCDFDGDRELVQPNLVADFRPAWLEDERTTERKRELLDA